MTAQSAGTRHERRTYVAILAFFVCLMLGIWGWVMHDLRLEHDEMWHGVLDTVLHDASADIEDGLSTARNSLQTLAVQLQNDGGPYSPEAFEGIFENTFTGLFTALRIYTSDGREIRNDGTVHRSDRFCAIHERFLGQNPAVAGRHCTDHPPAGNLTIVQPVYGFNTVTAYLEGDFNIAGHIRQWEEKISYRQGFLGLINRRSEILHYAGKDASSVFAPIIGNPELSITHRISLGLAGSEHIEAGHGLPAAYAMTRPVGGTPWQVLAVVPGDDEDNPVMPHLSLALLEGAAVLFFFLVLNYYRRNVHSTSGELDRLAYVAEGERILFASVTDHTQLEESLARVARMIRAGGILFKIYPEGEHAEQVFAWFDGRLPGRAIRRLFSTIDVLKLHWNGGADHLCVSGRDAVSRELRHSLGSEHVPASFCAVPVRDADRKSVGVVVAFNTEDADFSLDVLRALVPGFAGFISTMRAYERVKLLGETDALTGLLNRNSFEARLAAYREAPPEALVCIYADANGLHEVNNTRGHEAGDALIRAVAGHLREAFGNDAVFRTGGDEFVVLIPAGKLSAAGGTMAVIGQSLAAQGMSCAFGAAALTEVPDLRALLRLAEKRMFDNKRQTAVHPSA